MFLFVRFTSRSWQSARSLAPMWWLLPELPEETELITGCHLTTFWTKTLTPSTRRAPVGKGFATASRALGSLALFGAYSFGAGNPWVFISFFFNAIRVYGADYGFGGKWPTSW